MDTRVVYLFGAGASHACVKRIGSPHGILMRDLTGLIQERLRELVSQLYSDNDGLIDLVNSVDDDTDLEHLITFLDDIPSLQHRNFADEMRKAFEQVLRDQLNTIREDARYDPIELYEVLLDAHNVDHFPESLHGIITINYDEYIELAVERVYDCQVDFGIRVDPSPQRTASPKLLKLHGSFGWQDTWPISRGNDGNATLWIPPGINKAKQTYPFNVLWGSAREMLTCDILRIVGCRLGPNDWDLISLLFTMRHASVVHRPRIEIIDAPEHAATLNKSYPYLEVLSILQVEPIGSELINELTGRPARRFEDFNEEEQIDIVRSVGTRRNWFDLWLTRKLEYHSTEIEDMSTPKGFVAKFLDM